MDELFKEANWGDQRGEDEKRILGEALVNRRVLNLNPERFEGLLRGRAATFEKFDRLSEFSGLVEVTLDNTRLRDVRWADDCRSIRYLSIRRTAVDDISALSRLTDLQILHLDGTRVKDLTPLGSVTSIRALTLSHCSVTDLAPLRTLRNLRSLDVSSTRVSDLTPIHLLKHLSYLNIAETRVTDVSCLTKLAALEEIDCTGVEIEDYGPIAHVPNLKRSNNASSRSLKSSPTSRSVRTGIVKFYNSTKGFGFITPEGGGKDVFVHISALERAGMRTLSEGQRVLFDTEADAIGAKAVNLRTK
jgi:cold shock CspA family protein